MEVQLRSTDCCRLYLFNDFVDVVKDNDGNDEFADDSYEISDQCSDVDDGDDDSCDGNAEDDVDCKCAVTGKKINASVGFPIRVAPWERPRKCVRSAVADQSKKISVGFPIGLPHGKGPPQIATTLSPCDTFVTLACQSIFLGLAWICV